MLTVVSQLCPPAEDTPGRQRSSNPPISFPKPQDGGGGATGHKCSNTCPRGWGCRNQFWGGRRAATAAALPPPSLPQQPQAPGLSPGPLQAQQSACRSLCCSPRAWPDGTRSRLGLRPGALRQDTAKPLQPFLTLPEVRGRPLQKGRVFFCRGACSRPCPRVCPGALQPTRGLCPPCTPTSSAAPSAPSPTPPWQRGCRRSGAQPLRRALLPAAASAGDEPPSSSLGGKKK